MIDEIWRYPVKSCSGEMVDLALIGTRGVDHDRSWAVVDRETGLVASAKHPRQWGSLLMIRSMVKADGSQVSVELPDKRSGSTGDRSTLDHLLSDYLGRSVGLEPAAQIRNPTLERTDPDPEALTGSGELTLSEVTTGPLGSASPPGTVFDFAPIHVLSTATLELLDEAGGDRRRFRPNLVVDIDGPAFQENDWPGKQLLIGDEMILNVLIPSPRCVVPSLPQLGLARSVSTIRAVTSLNRIKLHDHGTFSCVGAYASVSRSGTVAVGTPATLVA